MPDGYPAYVRLLQPVVDEEDLLHAWSSSVPVPTHWCIGRPCSGGALTAGMRCGGHLARPGKRVPSRSRRPPIRSGILVRPGGLSAALQLQDTDEAWPLFQSPNLVWQPSAAGGCLRDRLRLTLIAGSDYFAAHLMRTDVLETWRVQSHHSLSPKTQTFSIRCNWPMT